MRIVAARMNHETNTFSPVPTPLSSFGPEGPTFGSAALDAARGTRTALGAFVDACGQRGAQLEVAVNATANPSGPVDDDAYERFAGAIVDAVAGGCDAILLDLHGAMVTRSFDDGEGELLRRVRAVAPETPLAVALDLHGNITERIIDHADIVVGFKTYPHIDMYETGAHAARLLFAQLDERNAAGNGLGAAAAPVPHAAQRDGRRRDAARGRARAADGSRGLARGHGVRRLRACRHSRRGDERRRHRSHCGTRRRTPPTSSRGRSGAIARGSSTGACRSPTASLARGGCARTRVRCCCSTTATT